MILPWNDTCKKPRITKLKFDHAHDQVFKTAAAAAATGPAQKAESKLVGVSNNEEDGGDPDNFKEGEES
jgi:hypothetical protein